MTDVEIVNPHLRRGPFAAAVFDFDGTVSLVREGWARIMAELGRDLLAERGLPRETGLMPYLEDQMLRLSGKPSIFQMHRLADIVRDRGGARPDPDAMLAEFLRRLFAVTDGRKAELVSGVKPQAWTVPGTHDLLDNLRRRGVALYLASGTDLKYVREEAALLDLDRYFGERVYAPADNTPDFSKRDVFARIAAEHGTVLSFGDGYSETVEAKRIGATVVGVASQEAGVPGVSAMKRAMLTELGADAIVPDYTSQEPLVAWLFGET